MNQPSHHFSDLFAQLGLPADADGIARFLAAHAPVAGGVTLAATWYVLSPPAAPLVSERTVIDPLLGEKVLTRTQ